MIGETQGEPDPGQRAPGLEAEHCLRARDAAAADVIAERGAGPGPDRSRQMGGMDAGCRGRPIERNALAQVGLDVFDEPGPPRHPGGDLTERSPPDAGLEQGEDKLLDCRVTVSRATAQQALQPEGDSSALVACGRLPQTRTGEGAQQDEASSMLRQTPPLPPKRSVCSSPGGWNRSVLTPQSQVREPTVST